MCECPVKSRTVKVGSGNTELARVHTKIILNALKELNSDVEFEIVTTDSLQENLSRSSDLKEKTVPRRRLDQALLLGEVDCVVSSLKDVPIKLHPGIVIGCVFKFFSRITEQILMKLDKNEVLVVPLQCCCFAYRIVIRGRHHRRESPYDVVVLHPKYSEETLDTLPNGSVIGTSSLRRSAQLSGRYRHLKWEAIKGSLNDRFRKLDEEDSYAALVLAEAGLVRLGWQHRISERLPEDLCMYAVCQGAIGVKCRENDSDIISLLKPIHDMEASIQCIAERSFFKNGNLSYKMPVSVFSEISGDEIKLSYGVFSTISDKCNMDTVSQNCGDIEEPLTGAESISYESDSFIGIVPPPNTSYSTLLAAEIAGTRLAKMMKEDQTTQKILDGSNEGNK